MFNMVNGLSENEYVKCFDENNDKIIITYLDDSKKEIDKTDENRSILINTMENQSKMFLNQFSGKRRFKIQRKVNMYVNGIVVTAIVSFVSFVAIGSSSLMIPTIGTLCFGVGCMTLFSFKLSKYNSLNEKITKFDIYFNNRILLDKAADDLKCKSLDINDVTKMDLEHLNKRIKLIKK